MHADTASHIQRAQPDIPDTAIQLRQSLWLDLEAGTLITPRKLILLSHREIETLKILVDAMRRTRGYVSAEAIALQLVSSEVVDPAHSIQETISMIRRKMGERPHAPRILRSRRNLGYRLFPQINQHPLRLEPHTARAAL